MKSFVKDSIMTHMRDENLLSSKQCGFITGRSIITPLLSHLDKCIDTIVSGGVVDTIYFRQITTKEDALQLQSNINSLKQWSQKWLLTFQTKTVMS